MSIQKSGFKVKIHRIDRRKLRDKLKRNKIKGAKTMAVLCKPRNSSFFIDKDKAKQFLEDSKANIVSSDFLDQCRQSASLFKRRDLSKKK